MAQHTFITYTKYTKRIADSICDNIFINSKILVESDLTSADLLSMAKKSTTEFFYVINSHTVIDFPSFDFSYKPPEWDKSYLHVWNNDFRIKLYCKECVLNNPDLYSDKSISDGITNLKIINDIICRDIPLDIIFLSYDEEFADKRFIDLYNRFPRVKRVHGIKGIYEAHKTAANVASTFMFYVVDADAEISKEFNFDYYPSIYDIDSVHVWYSQNPVNDLTYGYGGVKLFPRQLLLDYNGSPIDFTTSVSKHFKVIPEISNITRFNTDPFSAWRSGFRECAKLASKTIHNNVDKETEERLYAWCNLGLDREFGDFAIEGAKAGAEFGYAHKNQPDILGLINDYKWLEKKFNS